MYQFRLGSYAAWRKLSINVTTGGIIYFLYVSDRGGGDFTLTQWIYDFTEQIKLDTLQNKLITKYGWQLKRVTKVCAMEGIDFWCNFHL